MNILTRGDFDGLICVVLLRQVETIDQVRFAHPKSVQDREVSVGPDDIVVNLPYHPDCGMWFDHHISEQKAGARPESFKGAYGPAPSCARLIYDYYRLPEWENDKYVELLTETDRIDSAQLYLNDILRPTGWVRLSNTVDPRTGYANSRDYFNLLAEWIPEHGLKDILEFPETHDKIRDYFAQSQKFEKQLKKHSVINGKVVITDFRSLDDTPLGSRFMIYALYPSCNVAVRIFRRGDDKRDTIAVGHSIITRTCKIDIGTLMAEYGGGGHVGAGSCQVPSGEGDDTLAEIVERLSFAY